MTEDVRERATTADRESEPDFETLYGQYHQFVRRALEKHYVDPNDLEDVTQEVFVVLLRRIDEASQKRSLGGWLYQIVRRVAANHHRGDQRRVRKHDALESVARSPGARRSLDPEERLAREEAWTFIRDFLESLDEEACAVFVMSEIEGLKGAEIASRLGLTLPMTYARIRSVRARFGQRVARERQGLLALLPFPGRSSTTTMVLATSWQLKSAIVVLALVAAWFLASRLGGNEQPPGPGPDGIAAQDSAGDREAVSDRDDIHAGGGPKVGTEVFGGIVVDPDDRPIANAVVCGDRQWEQDHYLIEPPLCTTSDDAGRFEIPGALRKAYTLEAMARGFVPARVHGRPTKGVRIVLQPGGSELSGVVLDVHGGPIEGAWVSIENRFESSLGATVQTNESGAFSTWVLEGPISLAAGADGYATQFTAMLAPSKSALIELGAESVIAGIVVDGETGEPVAGARVAALLYPGPDKYANRQGLTFSDARGRFEIRGLQPSFYVLDATTERAWGRASRDIELGIADRHEGVRIQLIPGTEIPGRIVDAKTGEPCVEGYAKAFDPAQSCERGSLVGDDGIATVPSLSRGVTHTVAVSCRGYLDQRFQVEVGDGPPPIQEWALEPGIALTVRIVDANAQPLSGWTVELVLPPGGGLELDEPRGHDSTDSEGAVRFDGLRPGTYEVLAHGPGHPPIPATDVAVGPEDTQVELTPPGGVPVTGSVVDASGSTVAGALVALQTPSQVRTPAPGLPGAEAEMLAIDGFPYHALTDPAGHFSFPSVAAGDYEVFVLPGDAAIGYLRPTNLAAAVRLITGEPLQTIAVADRALTLALRLESLSSIAGTVRSEDGDVVADARVFAVREAGGRAADPRGSPHLSDREGRYSCDDLVKGTYTLTAYRPGGGVVHQTGIEAGAKGVDLVFPVVGEITGTVRTAEGKPAQGFQVFTHGPTRRDYPFAATGSIDGTFTVGGLEAGGYHLRVVAPEGIAEADVDLAPGQTVSGLELVLGPRTMLVGKLVDPDGKPVIGMIRVHAVDPTPERDVRLLLLVEPGGRFEIPDVPPIPLRLSALTGPLGPDNEDGATELVVVTPKKGETTDLGTLVARP